MERKYILATASIEEVKALESKKNLAYQTSYESADQMQGVLHKGYDPNEVEVYIIYSENTK